MDCGAGAIGKHVTSYARIRVCLRFAQRLATRLVSTISFLWKEHDLGSS